jgi:hypothetical protein
MLERRLPFLRPVRQEIAQQASATIYDRALQLSHQGQRLLETTHILSPHTPTVQDPGTDNDLAGEMARLIEISLQGPKALRELRSFIGLYHP